MIATINAPPAVSIADATFGVAAGTNVTNGNAAPNIGNLDDQASIVELSPEAIILSTSAAATVLENAAQNALAFQGNIEQLAALAVAAQATLTQDAVLAQQTALTSAEMTLIDKALQSALADTALNEALAAEAATVVTPTTIPAPAQPVVVNTPTTTATLDLVASAPTVSMAAAAAAAQAIDPAIPNTDPAVAAAIAAYRLGDGLFTERDPRAEEIPQEEELDIMPLPAIQGIKVDLHDSARDDTLHGAAWNWVRVHPVQRKNTQR